MFGKLGRNREYNLCKGRVYRYRKNNFYSKEGNIEFRCSYRFIKSKSCKGCFNCLGFEEDINNCGVDRSIIALLKHPVNGKLYKLVFVANGYDEMGYCDDWFYKMVEYND